MDVSFADDFEDFVMQRLKDVDISEKMDLECNCRNSYIQGFRDAIKVMAG